MATLWVAMSFTTKAPSGAALTLVFDHYVGDKILQFDTVSYTNALGQSFTVTKFKYYIGKIHLEKAGRDVAYDDYYLIDEENEPSKKITLTNIPAGDYTGMDFIIGVDSIDNCSGAQSGALDPVNAMFWAWNTGYIFLKLEGRSPASTSPGNVFEYHIGGYKKPANCIRHVAVKFGVPISLDNDHHGYIHIKADVAEILKNPTTIDISKLSSVTDFHNAATIADNYAHMFSFLGVENPNR